MSGQIIVAHLWRALAKQEIREGGYACIPAIERAAGRMTDMFGAPFLEWEKRNPKVRYRMHRDLPAYAAQYRNARGDAA